jgi:phosphoglycerate dehydrogenase-like enzyme
MSSPRLLVSLPDSQIRGLLGDTPNGVEFIEWNMSGPAPVDAIDVVVPPYMGTAKYLARLAGVNTRLVQSLSLGYDGVAEVLPPGHVFANAAGVHEASTAELALALILASQRGIPDFVRAAERGHWSPRILPSLADRTVVLVGYGGVGRAIEQRLLQFEVTVVRIARTSRTDERGQVHGIESLPQLLERADIAVIALPLTDETTHLVDDAFLSRMPDHSLLVNVARGKVADTAALLSHAGSGRLRLALDVTDPEPLPEGHPFFALHNVLISPHVGGASTAMMPRVARLLNEQFARLLRDEEPLNVVLRS